MWKQIEKNNNFRSVAFDCLALIRWNQALIKKNSQSEKETCAILELSMKKKSYI